MKELRRPLFEELDPARRPFYYFTLPEEEDCALLDAALLECVERGCVTLIPQPAPAYAPDKDVLALLKWQYAYLLQKASERGLTVAFTLSPVTERLVLAERPELAGKVLQCKEYLCTSGERFSRKLADRERTALVGISEEYCEIHDLRDSVKDSVLCWQVPQGNYVVREYYTANDTEPVVNYLSYADAKAYLDTALSLFSDTVTPYLGNTLSLLAFSDIGFRGQNHRAWDTGFNKAFLARFGFDPAP